MLKIGKAILVGLAFFALMVVATLAGNAFAEVSFSLMGWWAPAAFSAAVVCVVASVSYFGNKPC